MRYFWLLTGASALSKIGNTFLYLAIPWVVLSSTGSPFLAAASLAFQYLPYLLAPLLGGLIDRFDRRRVYCLAEVLQAGAVAVVPWLLHGGHNLAVMTSLFLVGLGGVVSGITSDYGLVPSLAPPDRTAQAFGRYSAVLDVARFIGPPLAGLTISAIGANGALWLDAVTFLITAAVAMRLPSTEAEREQSGQGVRSMLRDGYREFRRLPGMGRLTLCMSLFNIGSGALQTALVALGASAWGWSAQGIGLALTAGPVASAAGSWLGPRLGTARSVERRIGGWFAGCAAGAGVLLIPSPVAAIAGYALICLGTGGMNVATMLYRHEVIPPAYAGRVNAIIRAFGVGALPVSSLLLGWAVTLPVGWMFLPVVVPVVAALMVWALAPPRGGPRVDASPSDSSQASLHPSTTQEGNP